MQVNPSHLAKSLSNGLPYRLSVLHSQKRTKLSPQQDIPFRLHSSQGKTFKAVSTWKHVQQSTNYVIYPVRGSGGMPSVRRQIEIAIEPIILWRMWLFQYDYIGIIGGRSYQQISIYEMHSFETIIYGPTWYPANNIIPTKCKHVKYSLCGLVNLFYSVKGEMLHGGAWIGHCFSGNKQDR